MESVVPILQLSDTMRSRQALSITTLPEWSSWTSRMWEKPRWHHLRRRGRLQQGFNLSRGMSRWNHTKWQFVRVSRKASTCSSCPRTTYLTRCFRQDWPKVHLLSWFRTTCHRYCDFLECICDTILADFILSELGNTANINFLHRGSTDDTQYLLDYSPQISGDNLQQARASLNDGNSLTLTNFGLGSATYEKLVLPRIFYR